MDNVDLISLVSIESIYLIIGFLVGFIFTIQHMVVELKQEENDDETFEEKERKKSY